MATELKNNFDQFCNDYKTALEEEQELGPEDAPEEKAIDKKPDYEVYQKLKKSGKKGDEMVSSFLSKIFDEDTRMIKEHLSRYFEFLVKDGVLKSKDIN